MELNGTQKFAAPPQAVWNALHTDATVNSCLPGGNTVSWHGDSALTLNISVGPVKGSPTVSVVEQSAPGHMKFALKRDNGSGELTVDLAPDGAGTNLTYSGSVQASGPLSVGLGLVQGMIRGQVEQFFSRLQEQVK
jgi:carbon monoxide dehydrogenase subunit G